MKSPLTKKQERFLRTPLKRINILTGSVRAGKTWISLIAWAVFVGTSPKNHEFLMTGKTITTLKRNCLLLLQELVGEDNFTFTLSQKVGKLFGRTVWLEGANDEGAEGKIRGMTLGGAYCDELTLMPKSFYDMLLTRLSESDAALIATSNPDAPLHWVKKEVIDNEKTKDIVRHWHFTIDDNDFLDAQYVEDLKKSFSGVFYDRFIKGEWVIAEGLVYRLEKQHLYDALPHANAWRYDIAVDFGMTHPTVFLGVADNGVNTYVDKEYYYNGAEATKKNADKSVSQLGDDFDSFVEEWGHRPRYVVVDPAAKAFSVELKKRGYRVREADNSVEEGIQLVTVLLSRGKLFINQSCTNTIREFHMYSWDEKAAEKGVERVIKKYDDCMDTMRYYCQTLIKKRRYTR